MFITLFLDTAGLHEQNGTYAKAPSSWFSLCQQVSFERLQMTAALTRASAARKAAQVAARRKADDRSARLKAELQDLQRMLSEVDQLVEAEQVKSRDLLGSIKSYAGAAGAVSEGW